MYENIPRLDLHGEYRFSANLLIKEFINDNYKLKNYRLAIVHGIGKGIIKDEVKKVLKENKLVEKYYINFFNEGEMIVELREN